MGILRLLEMMISQSMHFGGAKPEIMLNFQKEYPKSKMVKMSTNYRSGKKIISEADRVIKSNTNRFQKKDFIGFKPENGAVEYIVTEEKKDEILKIYSRIKKLLNDGENPADIAVLFRTNRQAEKKNGCNFIPESDTFSIQ